jgi:hypothetical protein
MTAVEWLLEHLEPNIMWTDKAEKIAEQAKEMELEKLLEAYERGLNAVKQSKNEFGSIFKEY